jgi:hypothetical protein
MTSSRSNFDPIGIVVDWLDACRQGQLPTLVDLYDDEAIIDCCQGGTFRGRLGAKRYRRPKLAHSVTGAFEVDALFPEADGVCLDYRNFNGMPVRTHFTFTHTGKILHTVCDEMRKAA